MVVANASRDVDASRITTISSFIVNMIMVVILILAVYGGITIHNQISGSKVIKTQKGPKHQKRRNVLTQSQVSYKTKCESGMPLSQARFMPLPESAHGAWSY